MTLALELRTPPPAREPDVLPATPTKATCHYCHAECGTLKGLGKHLLDGHSAGALPPSGTEAGGGLEDHDLADPARIPFESIGDLLSAEEERSLAETMLRGGPAAAEARDRFVHSNQRLVIFLAKRYRNWGLSLTDLVQEGNLGLLRAIDKFDPGRDVRFSTYATWWILQALRKGLVETGRLVRVPGYMLGLTAKAKRMMREDPDLGVEGVAAALGTAPEKITEALGLVDARSMSMESGDRYGDGRSTLGSSLASPEDEVKVLDAGETARLLEGLSPKHRHIIARRFGLDGRAPTELEAVGKELGITRERVRQMEAQALAFLRKNRLKDGPDGGEMTLDLSPSDERLRTPKAKSGRIYLQEEIDPNYPAEAPAERRTPLPHQEEALAAIIPELEARGRATAVMACGTGKTLVGTWTFERTKGRTVLILGPSLALLRQNLREWLAHDAADRYLCVCSDSTVRDEGELGFSAKDLGIPVTTDPGELRRMLSKSHEGRSAVLCTYQSARALGAGLPAGFKFDLAVFDEAHRTAGARDRNFSFGLLDSQIGARRRLFMTATPRGVVSDGSETSAFSMNDERIYGRQVYELGLSDAIARGIICDYKVVIAVVTEAEVARMFDEPAHVWAKGGAVSAREAAYTVAFARAVQECGAAKIITFHEGVRSADLFARSRWLREDLLPEFRSYHVNGMMPTTMRQAILARFNAAKASLVTNARCLNEGVDIPAVDMVAFMSPKKSRIEIIQTIGRALRKAPGKTVGYVMVPILVDANGNPLSTAAEYRDLSQVIHTLRSQDRTLDQRVRKDSFDKGLSGGDGTNPYEDRLLVAGAEMLPETMRRAITAKVLSPLGSTWDEMFGRLVAFKKSHGTCLVPKSHEDPQLAKWVVAQRQARRRRVLSERQTTLLDSVEFPWSPKREAWSTMISALREWKEKHGHCNVPGRRGKLGGFVGHCRRLKRNGKLYPERIAELEAMGFEWKENEYWSEEEKWNWNYGLLKRFRLEEGNADLVGASEDLRRWATRQRVNRAKGKLSPEKETLLDSMGFTWKKSVSRLQRPRKTSREKRQIGTIVVRRDFTNGRDVETRWIKVSDTGPDSKRWKAYARWWWEQNRGPVPAGKGVIHKNGDSMDDSPENLMIGGAGDRIRLAHINNPEMSKRNMRTVHEGCAAWNREQGKKSRFKNIVRCAWYPVIEGHRVVLNIPFRKRKGLFRAFGADVSKIPLSGLGPEVNKVIKISGILPITSAQLETEPFSKYARVDVDFGLANPQDAGPDAERRMRAVMRMPLWKHAKAAAALDVHERQ